MSQNAKISKITEADVYECLKKVIDPELQIDIVSLGLIYKVTVADRDKGQFVHILMTLTTPGCPLAGVFHQLLADQLEALPDFDTQKDLEIELTFDPPWLPEMMTEEARAELGL